MKFTEDSLFEDSSLEIDITPLVDIVFLLLIFFMVSTTFIEATGIKVDLPSATSKPAAVESKAVEISVSADGKIFLGGQTVDAASLPAALKKELEAGAQPVLVLRADEKSRHGLVVEIMDTARQAGIEKMAVATIPKER